MRIQIHDFGGYPFVADLSKCLVELGNQVDHVYSAQYSANVGEFASRRGNPTDLTVTGLRTEVEPDKYGIAGRLRFERAYARAWEGHATRTSPDIVVNANVPLVALSRIERWTRRANVPWVLWHQDVVSLAMADELRRRLPAPIAEIGAHALARLERRLALRATSIVAIGAPFAAVYRRWGLPASRYEIVPNWAPLEEIHPAERENDWSLAHLPANGLPRLVYAGTLGRKHRPSLLLDLARGIAARGRPVELVVVSEGPVAEEMVRAAAELGGSKITLLPFQPAEVLPEVLGAGDVLVALLEPEAAAFSVPSKVLTYLAAGRPVLGLMPESNSAAAAVLRSGGFVADPTSAGVAAAVDWLHALMSTPDHADALGRQARAFAQTEFSSRPAIEALTGVVERSVLH